MVAGTYPDSRVVGSGKIMSVAIAMDCDAIFELALAHVVAAQNPFSMAVDTVNAPNLGGKITPKRSFAALARTHPSEDPR